MGSCEEMLMMELTVVDEGKNIRRRCNLDVLSEDSETCQQLKE